MEEKENRLVEASDSEITKLVTQSRHDHQWLFCSLARQKCVVKINQRDIK